MAFANSYRPFFQVNAHDLSGQARNYLCGLVGRPRAKNMERMGERVPGFNYQAQQQFLSDSPWDHRVLMDQVARDASVLLGGDDAVLAVDESAFRKKGRMSAGVARQWNGCDGKVDNCQVGVFAALCRGTRAVLVDARLYLPECWSTDPGRCAQAKIPEGQRVTVTKNELAWTIVENALEEKVRFGWVAWDAFYGRDTSLLRRCDEKGLRFVADVGCDQLVEFTDGRGRTVRIRVDALFAQVHPCQWRAVVVREGTKGPVRRAQVCQMRVGVRCDDGQVRHWRALCLRDPSTGECKYVLTNADAKYSVGEVVRAHSGRFWIERAFEDGKSSLGMGDYQARGWPAWHHHMALVMLAMLFTVAERLRHGGDDDLLSVPDLVDLLDVVLPRAATTAEEVLSQIERRHRQRAASIESARRKQNRETARPPRPLHNITHTRRKTRGSYLTK